MGGTFNPQDVFNPAAREITQGEPDWYTYTFDFLALLPNAVATITNQIDASAQFLLTAISYQAVAIVGGSTYTWDNNPVPAVRMVVFDSGSSKQLMNNPTYLNCLAGTGGLPQRLIHPRFFDKSSAVQMQVTSDDSTTWGHLQISFVGFRIYG
jgi:hypothetical protein